MHPSSDSHRPWFLATNGRCALDLNRLLQPLPRSVAVSTLKGMGLVQAEVDPVTVARALIGRSRYSRGAALAHAPGVVDCSSFIKWVFAQCGIWLPRRSIQQRLMGIEVPLDSLRAADLVFTTGPRNYHLPGIRPVGHVGLSTGSGSVVHAAMPSAGVREITLDQFTCAGQNFRSAVRIVPEGDDVITLITPADREIESEDDLRWLVAVRLDRLAD